MTNKKYKFYKVADHPNELEWAGNNIAVVELKGKKICLGRLRERISFIGMFQLMSIEN